TIPGIIAPGSACDALPAGIAEAMPEPGLLEVFPVPATDGVIVRTGDLRAGARLQLIDGRGAVLAEKMATGMITGFDISGLTGGLYALRAFDGSTVRVGRFVKE
ncbi:MAG TPA: T9SS type A sorting domain-containing protein, partial [Flavobacteriales bacterium]|nr:T9SS type A sorting domain-containing protein [Flavobacteriales bacterium]